MIKRIERERNSEQYSEKEDRYNEMRTGNGEIKAKRKGGG
jgi:hypothetical protein